MHHGLVTMWLLSTFCLIRIMCPNLPNTCPSMGAIWEDVWHQNLKRQHNISYYLSFLTLEVDLSVNSLKTTGTAFDVCVLRFFWGVLLFCVISLQ